MYSPVRATMFDGTIGSDPGKKIQSDNSLTEISFKTLNVKSILLCTVCSLAPFVSCQIL